MSTLVATSALPSQQREVASSSSLTPAFWLIQNMRCHHSFIPSEMNGILQTQESYSSVPSTAPGAEAFCTTGAR